MQGDIIVIVMIVMYVAIGTSTVTTLDPGPIYEEILPLSFNDTTLSIQSRIIQDIQAPDENKYEFEFQESQNAAYRVIEFELQENSAYSVT